MLRYAGFGRRLFANLVDTAVHLPLIVLVWPGVLSRDTVLAFIVPAFGVGMAYSVVMHACWGQTLGKMAARIQVVTVDGEAIGWREALLRDSVGIALGCVSLAAFVVTLRQIPDASWSGNWKQWAQTSHELMPAWGEATNIAQNTWGWSEVLVLLFNRKKRALHDFMAGTVVIRQVRA